jgi:hypothetical protein
LVLGFTLILKTLGTRTASQNSDDIIIRLHSQTYMHVNKGVFITQKNHQLIICPLLIIYAMQRRKNERKIDKKKKMGVFFF